MQPPNTSLGQLINSYRSAMGPRPWLFWWPGLFVIAIALCINFIGDGLRDAFDPRQRRMPGSGTFSRVITLVSGRSRPSGGKSTPA